MKTYILISALICAIGIIADDVSVEVKKIPAVNLLKNPQFMVEKDNKAPKDWLFSNYSKLPGFEYQADNGVFHIQTTGGLYGYLVQPGIPVEEGKKYYAEAWVKLNSRALLWLITMQYDDKLSPFFSPKSGTRIFSIANPDHGENLVRELQYFISPDYLLPVSETKWNHCALEFTVPAGHGITSYDFRIGSYGGSAGWIEIKDPYFGSAVFQAVVTLGGTGLTELKVCTSGGGEVKSFPLDPKRKQQKINITLESRLFQYYMEITNQSGLTVRRSL